jgi:hypothetical protein
MHAGYKDNVVDTKISRAFKQLFRTRYVHVLRRPRGFVIVSTVHEHVDSLKGQAVHRLTKNEAEEPRILGSRSKTGASLESLHVPANVTHELCQPTAHEAAGSGDRDDGHTQPRRRAVSRIAPVAIREAFAIIVYTMGVAGTVGKTEASTI